MRCLVTEWELTRRLYERRYAKEEVLELFRLIDWLLHLPENQRIEFRRELIEYEARKRMPYITSIEEMGRQEGRQEGLREGVITALEIRFGPAPHSIRKTIDELQDEARLRSLHRIAIQASSICSVRRSSLLLCTGSQAHRAFGR
jgi:hypothetical protein